MHNIPLYTRTSLYPIVHSSIYAHVYINIHIYIQLEFIPAHLRSAEKLYQFFDDLFPGEVSYTMGMTVARILQRRWTYVTKVDAYMCILSLRILDCFIVYDPDIIVCTM